MNDWPWPDDEPSTGYLYDRLTSSRQRLIDALTVGKDPGEVYDALRDAGDPGMHYERELTEFYDRLDK